MSLVSIIGQEKLERDLDGLAMRLVFPEPGLSGAMHELEVAEATRYAELNGKYVRTGATKASLTGSGSGAIRVLTAEGAEFGTSIPYAHYRKNPTVMRGVLTDAKADIGHKLMAYIMYGSGRL